ncbi:hypothetical protein Ade02nite_54670 [Paractinoplanes deccanensis]|uniref:Uncharacterized protein n=1 Tax=Paractinoplanes deccanensis TaxID=113561 RepID=A0ABQ3YA27_9ACTN|nr:hypothetical protein [Actinoplanes deccanensis]GID76826.1 hypothetical protein Ade02nite_54670 [Actinoplanes deccanensis]
MAARLGGDYAFVPMALGTIGHRGVRVPEPNTFEGILYGVQRGRCLVDARGLVAAAGEVVPRSSGWFGYSPLDPAQVAGLDALVFVRDAPEGPVWWPPA